MPFSVLMSLYYKEKPAYARECFESLLAQTAPADEWVIVEDGKLTDELYALLDEYEAKYPELIVRVPLEQNVGLGKALNEGLKACKYELVARMDTDDVCVSDRFEQQLKIFSESDADIVGGNTAEFTEDVNALGESRVVPVTDAEIKEYMKNRNAFNHMTVMFKKQAVMRCGSYMDMPYHEDYYLWVRMALGGCKMQNTGTVLVKARVDEALYRRRGGYKYYKNGKKLQKFMLKNGFIGRGKYVYNCMQRFIVQVLMPNRLRGLALKKLARKKVDDKGV